MKACVNCGHENAEGVLFCERCGVALSSISLSTKQLGENEKSNLQSGGTELSSDRVIFLYVKGYADPITVQMRDRMVLGRGDAREDENLVNLEPYEASDYGVSRRHAMLILNDKQLEIVDLGSTNHTYINEVEVPEDGTQTVHDGDELRLGRLNIRLFFK